ncbi:hypothetical protein RI129_003354 [Pyrocoelia pectoralis]|uniref:Uncharacterized protein n=1 Tax=Pyrocoelia pectoralis TaxID=417401 RepID=A0AAN7VHX2_9COLE
MSSENLKIQLEHEIYDVALPIYKKYLKRVLVGFSSVHNYILINQILENLVIPDECFSWCARYRNVSVSNIKLLIGRKLELDELVKSIVNCSEISDCSSTRSSKINNIVNSLPLHLKIYITNLLNCATDIESAYKDIRYVISEGICESAEYANVNSLQIFINLWAYWQGRRYRRCNMCICTGRHSFGGRQNYGYKFL